MKIKLPRMPFILAGLLIVLLAVLAGEYFTYPTNILYSAPMPPWDFFCNDPMGVIEYAFESGKLGVLHWNQYTCLVRGYGFLAGVIWLIPMVFLARRPGGNTLLRLRNFVKLMLAGMLMGGIVGALCGGAVHLHIHTMEGIRELTPAVKWGGFYVGLVFGGGAGAILGLLGGWQMWAVQLAALSGLKEQNKPTAEQ